MAAKIDLTQATFLVPLKFDSLERVRNLLVMLRFLSRHVETTVTLTETGAHPAFPPHLAELPAMARYDFVPDARPFFHRTRLLNRMLRACATPVAVVCDADVVCHPAQLKRAMAAIAGGADMVLPYDGRFLDVPEAHIPRLLGPPAGFPGPKECAVLYADGTGGMVFFRKERLCAAGLYNERFRSWGHEDRELLHRMTMLGYRFTRVPGCMLHLHHPRHADSHPMKNPYFADNTQEYERMRALDRQALRAAAAAFPWRDATDAAPGGEAGEDER